MSTDHPRSKFSDFDALERLLRKSLSEHDYMLEDCGWVSLVIDFNLDWACPLEDVRISILPLLLETSVLPRHQAVIIRRQALVNSSKILVAESTITQHKLRSNVADALEDFVYSQCDGCSDEVWINGLGELSITF